MGIDKGTTFVFRFGHRDLIRLDLPGSRRDELEATTVEIRVGPGTLKAWLEEIKTLGLDADLSR
jgi:hypothetical protein